MRPPLLHIHLKIDLDLLQNCFSCRKDEKDNKRSNIGNRNVPFPLDCNILTMPICRKEKKKSDNIDVDHEHLKWIRSRFNLEIFEKLQLQTTLENLLSFNYHFFALQNIGCAKELVVFL